MIDLPVWDYGYSLLANVNNPEFREHSARLTIELVKFMQDSGMAKRLILKDGEMPPDDLVIRESDLTELGLAMVNDLAVHRWLAANEDIRKPISMRVLERSLKKHKPLSP